MIKSLPIKVISDYCKSLSGILTFTILIVSGASLWWLRHDAKVIKSYVDSTQVKTNVRFKAILMDGRYSFVQPLIFDYNV